MDTRTIINFAVGQRVFNHELLLALIASGALERVKASAVAGKTAEFMRQMDASDQAEEALQEGIARGFEEVAAAIAGLPPIDETS